MQAGTAAPAAGGYGELALTSLLVLVVVCVVVLVAARYAGRWLGGRRTGAELVTVRARVPLEPRRSLYLVEVGGRTLLLGSSEGGVTLLTELAAGEVPAAVEATRGGFGELVARAMAKRGRPSASQEPMPDQGPSQNRNPTPPPGVEVS